MALTSDQLVDRKRLKLQVSRWRSIALLLVFLASAYASYQYLGDTHALPTHERYVARITIADVMVDDPALEDRLEEIRTDTNAKALVVRMDSPGGTALAGEELATQLRRISAEKPVVVVMRTVCASACYMAAVAGDYIVARSTSLTGSIGVVMEWPEISRLADKLGITPMIVKSGAYKDVPSATRPMTDEEMAYLQRSVDDTYDYFKDLVQKRRKLSDTELQAVTEARVFTGREALKLKLVDALGGELEARAWLEKTHKIPADLEIYDYEPKEEFKSLLEEFAHATGISNFSQSLLPLDGLVSIWHLPRH